MAINRTYESEATRFLRDLVTQKPELSEEQRKARAIWWDKKIDPEEARRQKESRVRQQAYVYQSEL